MGFNDITDLFLKNTILFAISIAVLSTFINELVFSFINDIVLPILDRDSNDDNEPDINKIKTMTVKTSGITFRVGSFIISLIRFIVLIFILFIIALIILHSTKKKK